MTSTPLPPANDLPEVNYLKLRADHQVTALRTAVPSLADLWADITTALDAIGPLSAEIITLRALVSRTRLELANLTAAARATLAAHREGEHDPLFYLADELDAQAQRHATPTPRKAQSGTDAPARAGNGGIGGDAR